MESRGQTHRSTLNFGTVKVGHSHQHGYLGRGSTPLLINNISIGGSSDFTESKAGPECELEDWLCAEQEITSTKAKTAAA